MDKITKNEGGLMQQVHKGFEKESPPKKEGTPTNSSDATLQQVFFCEVTLPENTEGQNN